MNPIELSLFSARLTAVCDEMGTVLRRTAFSPNIKDRLDFSCAVFDEAGQLCAQAAHIPVHLGSMAYAMADLVRQAHWRPGDMMVVNDPFLGGTHLPDVTLLEPVFTGRNQLAGFVANRAHHADIGCDSPGSMPISTRLGQEGRVIPPTLLFRGGVLQTDGLAMLTGTATASLTGDFAAQVSANRVGAKRLQALVDRLGLSGYGQGIRALNEYGERLARQAVAGLRPGRYHFTDYLDDDGISTEPVPLTLDMTITPEQVLLDFTQCPDQVAGNLNCPLPVTAAAAYYVFRCLMDEHTPACAGTFGPVKLLTRPGSIVDARRPAAVAAGNVETSTRLVDVIMGALASALPERIPAASQGSMNNIAMGHIDRASGTRWDYYETLGGGCGGGPRFAGLSGVHSHMTNTLNTPVESVEMHYPLRVLAYGLRRGSGGSGRHGGGDGISREYQFLAPAQVSLITERRRSAPWGLAGGAPGASGENRLNGKILPGKCQFTVGAGDRLQVLTPGGGGYGADSGPVKV